MKTNWDNVPAASADNEPPDWMEQEDQHPDWRERCHSGLNCDVISQTAEQFLDDIEAVCRKHGLSIGHEDHEGGFKISKFDERLLYWLRDASLDEDYPYEFKNVMP